MTDTDATEPTDTANDHTDLNQQPVLTGPGRFDRILDIPVRLTVELGRRRLPISEVLSLVPGSVVEFQKAAEDPLDILVNDRLVARGQAVVMGDRYGVRVIEVISPGERLQGATRGDGEST